MWARAFESIHLPGRGRESVVDLTKNEVVQKQTKIELTKKKWLWKSWYRPCERPFKMEANGQGGGAGAGNEAQLLISGVGGDQPLVMSAEDAAQFLAQAGLQLADVTDGGEQVIINSADLANAGLIKVSWIAFT